MKKAISFIFGKKPLIRLLIYFLIILFIRAFIFECVPVKNNKMEGTIYSGDRVIVNKLKYGPRIPITLLSVPFVNNVWKEMIQLPYFRLPGFGKIKRNDLISFNNPKTSDNPIDKKTRLIKRVIGLPGDSVSIDSKDILVNGEQLQIKTTKVFNFRIVSDGTVLDKKLLKDYPITEIRMISDIGIYDISMNRETAELLLSEDFIRTVRELKQIKGPTSRIFFPASSFFRWNSDYFGPIYVPAKGEMVNIDFKNIYLYKRIIDVFEGHELRIHLEDVFVDGEKITEYRFKKDYYFVLDDNIDNGNDSRYWGFVPEDHIIGKANRVWRSRVNKDQKGAHKFRRFLKKLH